MVPSKTGSNTQPGLWTAIEASLGIVAACLPSLGPVLHKMTGQPLSTTSDTTAKSQLTFARLTFPFHDADANGFERILDLGPRGQDETVTMNTIVGRCPDSLEIARTRMKSG